MEAADRQPDKEKVVWPLDGDRLLKTPEVAFRLGTNSVFVGKLYKYKLLKVLRFGTERRVRRVTLDAFLEEYEGQDLKQVVMDLEKEAREKNHAGGI